MGLDLVGKRLKAVREKHAQSHEDIAGVLGLDDGTAIAEIETGERKITGDDLVKLMAHFEVDLEYFTDPFRLEEGEAQWHWNTSSGPGETENCHLWPAEEPSAP